MKEESLTSFELQMTIVKTTICKGLVGRLLLSCFPLLTIFLMACIALPEFEGTYRESAPLEEGREFAYEISFFRFGDEVGGVVRYFQIQGPLEAYYNTTENPYVVEGFCSYFGPVVIRTDRTIAFTVEGPQGQVDTFQFDSPNPESLMGELSRFESAASSGSSTLTDLALERSLEEVDDTCEARGDFEVLVEWPLITLDEASNLTLVSAYSAYTYDEETEVREPVITLLDAASVSLDTSQEYITNGPLSFPQYPPTSAFSAADDPVQNSVRYAVGYVYLFNDVNEDGDLDTEQDQVLAVSQEQAVIYMDGDLTSLAPSVAAVFQDVRDLVSGYDLYEIELIVEAGESGIVEAYPKGRNRMVLQAIEPGESLDVPLLIPTGDLF